jgi:hypothetical protein
MLSFGLGSRRRGLPQLAEGMRIKSNQISAIGYAAGDTQPTESAILTEMQFTYCQHYII